MSLTTVTTTLDATWTRRLRQHNPQQRWARRHPALGGDLAALRQQLADWASPRGRARLAELVDLARSGDHDAAVLATLTILPTFVERERRCVSRRQPANHSHIHDYDTLAGAVWEALLTSRSYKPAHLREDITRQAWLIARRRTLAPGNEITDNHACHHDRTDTVHGQRGTNSTNHPGDVCDIAISNVTITALLDRLSVAGRLSQRGRRVLQSIAAGGDGRPNQTPPQPGRADAQYRLRLLNALRLEPTLADGLAA